VQETEAWIASVFADWLRADEWIVEAEVDFCDLVAVKGGKRLLVEAKGRTAATGLDLDTAYGQLLRRMKADPTTSYALVVPASAAEAARRVPAHVRAGLGIEVYAVSEDGRVDRLGG
jgi:hypothetical protein